MLYDSLFNQACSIYYIACVEVFLKTTYVYRNILGAVDVTETRELRKTTCQRSLATLESYTLTATSTRLLTIETTTSSFAVTRSRTTTNTFTITLRAFCWL